MKHDPAFMNKGFSNWKDTSTAFTRHLASKCHKEAVAVDALPKDVAEKLSTLHVQEKADNCAMLRQIQQNIRFLSHHGLVL